MEHFEKNFSRESTLRTSLNQIHDDTEIYVKISWDACCQPDYKGCFSKSLQHTEDGLPVKEEIQKMLDGIFHDRTQLDQLNYPGPYHLVNPSTLYSTDLVGYNKAYHKIPKPPRLESAQHAAEMVELYAMALARDVSFEDYADSELIHKILPMMNKLLDFKGPQSNGIVTPQTLFRGDTAGDLQGPYVSQFLWLPYQDGAAEHTQKYRFYEPQQDFMKTWQNALSVQNGTPTEEVHFENTARYLLTLRDGATYVHLDDPIKTGYLVSQVLDTMNCPVAPGIELSSEESFVDLNVLDYFDMLSTAVRTAMSAAWLRKWTYLRVRPEVSAMLYEHDQIPFHKNITKSGILSMFDSALLPQAYPDGSPCHPAYPAGHAVFAGATSTILKAFYDENYVFEGIVPNADGSKLKPLGRKLRVGDELDKLASNIALFRNGAGVHYRSDALGLQLGEQIALNVLEACVKRYKVKVQFKFHLRSGQLITIAN